MSQELDGCKKVQTEIKKEDDSSSFPSNLADSPNQTSQTQCGYIFTANYFDFVLICTLCQNSYDNIFDFGEHLRQNHRQAPDHSPNIEGLGIDSDSASEVSEKGDDVQNVKGEILNFDEKEYICEFCKMSFRTFDCLEQHECDPEYLMGRDLNLRDPPAGVDAYSDPQAKANESASRLYTCKICRKQYSHKSSLNRHRCCGFPMPHKQNIFKCEVCKKDFSTKNSLKGHKCESGSETRASTPNVTTCANCNKQYESMDALKRHRCLRSRGAKSFLKKKTNGTNGPPEEPLENKISNNAASYCEFCDKHFKSISVLKSHAIVHEIAPIALQNSPGYLTCYSCDAKFSNHIEWYQHESTHSVPFRYKCPHCSKMCRTRYTLNMHINSHTGARPFKCSKCPASFAHHGNLSTHNKRIHLKQHPYACHLCDVRCVKNSELRFHMRKHTGERPHQCDLCGKRFIQPVLLREHLKIHANIKDIQCPVCSTAFVTKKRLKDHMVKHSDERPHACDICGDTFSRRKAMRVHRKIHLPEKGYVCQICGKAFAQGPGLYSHMKSHGVVSTDKPALDI